MVYISTSSICLQLPNASGFEISPRRFKANRRANAGNIIRQTSAYDVSSAEPSYKGLISESDALALLAMHATSPSIYLTYKMHCYTAIMDVETLAPANVKGKYNFSANFGIVGLVV